MKNKLSGFSLMEMLVVLLIIAIVMAASAPMVNRKMLSSMAEKSPWVWTNTTGSIAYNLNGNDNQTTTIGAMALPSGSKKARLYISNGASETPQIAIGEGTAGTDEVPGDPMFYIHKYKTSLGISTNIIKKADSSEPPLNCIFIGNDAKATKSNGIALGAGAEANSPSSVAIGHLAGTVESMSGGENIAIGLRANAKHSGSIVIGADTADDNGSVGNKDVIAIGRNAKAIGENSIAIGHLAETVESASGGENIAIGLRANAKHSGSIVIGADTADNNDGVGSKDVIAIGRNAKAYGDNSIAIGHNAQAQGATSKDNTIAIGLNASALGNNAVAIGAGAVADADNKIVIGTEDSIVYIPGQLRLKVGRFVYKITPDNGTVKTTIVGILNGTSSDRRLKNVGEVFTGGLEQIKKLEVFNYTFKKDTEKTPRVGVMAQDLQKIFPNAVFKGEDGFLRIRMEDMFYALVNAVKELDAKVQMIVDKNIAGLKKQIAYLEEENRVITEKNAALEKQIASLYEQNAKLEERMNVIEKQLANKKNK